ncbi:unnamed protein product [Schistocephalus solidus]|uniref:Reverse transcriptase domain-containing protein n=1 Tax=Schistocephalus solidus TaxID=70667 RepID=A0A183SAG6_SCHSO|nr:unnamed protein product [Schistocephalus solidus]
MQEVGMVQNTAELQGCADRNEMKNFFKLINAIYGPCIKGIAPLLSSDGTKLLTKKSQMLKCRTEHFSSVLNPYQPSPMLQETRCQGQVPQEFKYATTAHLFQQKGNRQICDNHRGISLLNITGKIYARILLNRLNGHLEQGLPPESQCGFRRHRGTRKMVVADRQLQEKCQKMLTHLHNIVVDLTKAFGMVIRDVLWNFIQKFGCPERFTHSQ